jgi:hypothetical protein
MNLTITLAPSDIDAMATGMGLAFAGMSAHELTVYLRKAAATQPGSPHAQHVLRLIAEVIQAEPQGSGARPVHVLSPDDVQAIARAYVARRYTRFLLDDETLDGRVEGVISEFGNQSDLCRGHHNASVFLLLLARAAAEAVKEHLRSPRTNPLAGVEWGGTE